MRRFYGVTLLALTSLVLAGCARNSTVSTPKAPVSDTREFVDLQPGWRLRIVAAVTKSGKYEVEFQPVSQEGNVITMRAPDLAGYETAFWAITARPGGGISISLSSAELTVDGKPSPIAKPTRALVHIPRSARYVRAFYLTRKSDADHNMALAGAARLDQLEEFTRAFRESPNEACAERAKRGLYCEWIPAGLAVRPEEPKIVNGVTTWPNQ